MSDAATIIDTVRTIAEDAREIVDLLTPKVVSNELLTAAELARIDALVARAGQVLEEASALAQAQRQDEIAALRTLIRNIDTALAAPGLSRATTTLLRSLRRRRRSRLLRLQTRRAMQFGGILSVRQVREVHDVLARARRAVASKKKASAFVGTTMQIADLALSIAARLAPIG